MKTYPNYNLKIRILKIHKNQHSLPFFHIKILHKMKSNTSTSISKIHSGNLMPMPQDLVIAKEEHDITSDSFSTMNSTINQIDPSNFPQLQ